MGPSQPAPITAVWKERRLSFSYSSDTTVYTCDALQGRVASVLRAVGARDDVKVRLSGCNDARVVHDPYASTPAGSRMDPMAPASERYRYRGAVTNTRQSVGVFVTAMLPTEVTDDVRAELEKDKSRRELVARATGNPAARFNDPVPFTAGWRQVTLSHQTVGFEPEECELVDQLTSVILPKIDVRTRSRSSSLCTANSVLAPQLVVEALMPVPYGGGGGLPRLKDEGANGEHDDDKGDDGKNDDGDPPAQ